MPRGSKPGERRGGREAGTPNKATIERQLVQARETHDAQQNGKKLAKEVLDEFMQLTAGMAAVYQPLPPGVTDVPLGRTPNETKFWECVGMVRDFAKALAPYQSPTFKAIAVFAPPDQTRPAAPALPPGGNVITLDDPAVLQRVYRNRIAKVT